MCNPRSIVFNLIEAFWGDKMIWRCSTEYCRIPTSGYGTGFYTPGPSRSRRKRLTVVWNRPVHARHPGRTETLFILDNFGSPTSRPRGQCVYLNDIVVGMVTLADAMLSVTAAAYLLWLLPNVNILIRARETCILHMSPKLQGRKFPEPYTKTASVLRTLCIRNVSQRRSQQSDFQS